jgi:catechol 2,3-dioxygenase-like lactoylglutathione lyase family enzyme
MEVKEVAMINALQHVGQGVWDVDVTYEFYKRFLGYKIKLNDITIPDKDMARIIGSVETLRAMMAINTQGGAVLELIENKSSPIRPYPTDGGYGNYGILEVGYAVSDIEAVVNEFLSRGVHFLTGIFEIPFSDERVWRCAYLVDPDGLRLQLVEEVRPNKSRLRGIFHVGIGVSDLARSKVFYNALEFDKLVYEFEGRMPEMDPVTGSTQPMKFAILERSEPVDWTVGFLPSGIVKLYELPNCRGKHIYEDRRWGDIGCMEMCLDVTDLQAVIGEMKAKGIDIWLPQVEIDMGSGCKGLVAYIRDPDGTLIELVEVKTVAWVSKSMFRRIAMPFLRLYDRLT